VAPAFMLIMTRTLAARVIVGLWPRSTVYGRGTQ
jgi:hypothetical protein